MHSLIDLSRVAVATAALGDGRRTAEAIDAVRTRLDSMPVISPELAGRKAADVGFSLALAGCSDDALFTNLCERATDELRRKTGRRAKGASIAAMAELFAASGCRSEQTAGLHQAALERLQEAGMHEFADTKHELSQGSLQLHSPRAARWLHRRHHHHSLTATQRRPAATVGRRPSEDELTAVTTRLGQLFADDTLDLTIDLGCGFGVGPLGVAMAASPRSNTLGCDLHCGRVAFATGVALRWGLAPRCAFAAADAGSVVQRICSGEYRGRLVRVCLSCPTPYAITLGGRSFPRAAAETLDFFASRDFLCDVAEALHVGGTLHLAANVEDVALTLFHNAKATGRFDEYVVDDECLVRRPSTLDPRPSSELDHELDGRTPSGQTRAASPQRPTPQRPTPQRQLEWRQADTRRAVGPAWESGRQILREARSETELAYLLEGRETYRVVLQKTR